MSPYPPNQGDPTPFRIASSRVDRREALCGRHSGSDASSWSNGGGPFRRSTNNIYSRGGGPALLAEKGKDASRVTQPIEPFFYYINKSRAGRKKGVRAGNSFSQHRLPNFKYFEKWLDQGHVCAFEGLKLQAPWRWSLAKQPNSTKAGSSGGWSRGPCWVTACATKDCASLFSLWNEIMELTMVQESRQPWFEARKYRTRYVWRFRNGTVAPFDWWHKAFWRFE